MSIQNLNFKKILKTSSGFFLILLTLFLLISLATYRFADPSWNHVSSNSVKNLAGYPGAYIADPLIQAFGFASFAVILFFASLGAKLIFKEQVKWILFRFSILFLSIPIFATLFSFLELSNPGFFLSSGGFVGLFIKEELLLYFDQNILAVSIYCAALIAFFLISNFSPKEWWLGITYVSKLLSYLVKLFIWFCQILSYKLKQKNYIQESEDKQDLDALPDEILEQNIIEIKSRKPKFITKKTPVQSTFKLDPNEFELPPTNLLKEVTSTKKQQFSDAALNQNSKLLEQVLQDFGVNGKIVSIYPGPVVTLYELEPSAGTKSSRVISLADDISRSMSAVSARIAVIPGKNALGIELPNSHREIVFLRELLESPEYSSSECKLPLVLGKNIGGEPVIADLAKMPHLLVAGTTGSGKSVAINTMVLSLLYKLTPKECQFIMIDPKMLELSVYEGIPHLLTPVVTEPKKAVSALKWVVKEMENRYRMMSNVGVRNIQGFNKLLEENKAKGKKLERQVQTGFDPETGEPIFESLALTEDALPYIVVIVDEMADLMLVAGKDIESYIQRLAQMARAAGIHIIMATQRPSVDVITGVIKANFPTRISFQVTSKIDSRTILGEQGAEQLLGMGDMLYMPGGARIERVHGPFVGDREVEQIVAFLKQQGTPNYKQEIEQEMNQDEEFGGDMLTSSGDDIYDQAVAIVLKDKRPTTSYLQRCLKIGYNRAANLIEKMEKEGILSSPNHMGKREILINEK